MKEEGKEEIPTIPRLGPRISHSTGTEDAKNRKMMEVEHSASSKCLGAFERRRETSTMEEKEEIRAALHGLFTSDVKMFAGCFSDQWILRLENKVIARLAAAEARKAMREVPPPAPSLSELTCFLILPLLVSSTCPDLSNLPRWSDGSTWAKGSVSFKLFQFLVMYLNNFSHLWNLGPRGS